MSHPPLPLSSVLIEEFEALPPAGTCPKFDLAGRRAELEKEWQARLAAAPAAEKKFIAAGIEAEVDKALFKEVVTYLHQTGVKRAALCLSGGGIRSATFSLGLVQALAKKKLLGGFDFLSTVSGGGYLGSWLSAWIHHARAANPSAEKAIDQVQRELASPPSSPLEPEPAPVQHLRIHSRYMSPKLGALSIDTWTLAATYLRNLLLNWLVFLPLIAAFLMLPRISIALVEFAQRDIYSRHADGWEVLICSLALLCGWLGIGMVAPSRPSLAENTRLSHWARGPIGSFWLCHFPLFLMAVSITIHWAWLVLGHGGKAPETLPLVPATSLEVHPALAYAVFGCLLHVGGLIVSWLLQKKLRTSVGELVIVPLSGLIGGAALWLALNLIFHDLDTPRRVVYYACFATPLVLMLYILATFLFVGLSKAYTTDADREWMARSGGWLFVTLVVRGCLSVVVFLGPVLFFQLIQVDIIAAGKSEQGWWGTLFTYGIGGVSGLLTLILGVSSKTGIWGGESTGDKGRPTRSLQDMVLALAAPTFIVFLLVILSVFTTRAVEIVTRFYPTSSITEYTWREAPETFFKSLVESPLWAVCCIAIGLVLVGAIAGQIININHFSLHATYRDRLIRAYLGASRPHRDPDPFTLFDTKDNLRMFWLQGNRPIHVINAALNMVNSEAPTARDRKATSFTISPFHTGSRELGYRPSQHYGGEKSDEVISLGTALAISGAAASPNMGYHSSAVITFLMAMFNLRLGWWLGNPGKAGNETYRHKSPKSAAKCLFFEALGQTNEKLDYVYLSDGGHFENLGLYEMVLRRCRFIVVSDAGHDPHFSFQDLGKAITQIRVDLGIPISFSEIGMRPRMGDKASFALRRDGKEVAPYCALGHIRYSKIDGTPKGDDGLLLYIKPSLNGTEPVNVYQYAHDNERFPHEPTADQFYSETQFESYRALGEHIMTRILSNVEEGATAEQLFQQIDDDLSGKRPDSHGGDKAAEFKPPHG